MSDALRLAFIVQILEADHLYHLANARAMQLGRPDHPRKQWVKSSPYGPEALAGATYLMGAAANSFFALRLLSIGEVRATEDAAELDARITLNGSAGLLRQSMECAARAKWLLDAKDGETLTVRGFAFAWWNASQAMLHHRAFRPSDASACDEHLDELVQNGNDLGLLCPTEKGNPRWKPRNEMADVAGLLRKESIPEGVFAGTGDAFAAGARNGEWLYRWCSGMAHGLAWVHPQQEPEVEGDGLVTHLVQPDYLRLSLSAFLARKLIGEAIEALSGENMRTAASSRPGRAR